MLHDPSNSESDSASTVEFVHGTCTAALLPSPDTPAGRGYLAGMARYQLEEVIDHIAAAGLNTYPALLEDLDILHDIVSLLARPTAAELLSEAGK